jgi:hypothetical protein
MQTLNESELDQLLGADREELLALLGAAALPLSGSATDLLRAGREGDFYSPRPPVLGDHSTLQHRGLEKVAVRFLSEWGGQIKSAVCGKDAEFEAAKKNGTTVLVASIASAITVHIPPLEPYTTLITVVAVVIIQSGFNAFCAE